MPTEPVMTDIFPWDPNFETGLPGVDKQHRRLVELLNELANRIASGASFEHWKDVFEGLTAYAAEHFADEEALWHQYMAMDATAAARHKETHDQFVHHIAALQGLRNDSVFGRAEDTLAFLVRWLASHILGSDRYMARVVLGLQAGLNADEAHRQAADYIAGANRATVDSLLAIYGTLAANTLHRMRDVAERRQAEAALRVSEERLAFALQGANDGLWDWNLDTNEVHYSARWFEMLGYQPFELPATLDTWATLVHPDDKAATLDAVEECLQGKRAGLHMEFRMRHRDGHWVDILSRARLACDEHGQPTNPRRLVGTHVDISERKKNENALHLYGEMFRHSGEAIVITDQENRIIDVNPAFTAMTGYSLDEVRGHNPRILAAGKTPRATYQSLWAMLASTNHWQGELWDRRRDGSTYPKWASISIIRDAAGAVTHHIASFTDISERKAAEARIDHLAHHDPLTGLYNRYSLEGRLAQSLLEAKRENRQVAIMFIDLDRFKVINDTLGHQIGDCLLVEVARRLTACVRESDIVARLGGDEFVIVPTVLGHERDAALIAGKVIEALAEPHLIDGKTLHATPSVGISVFPENGEDAGTLMKNADTAMYHAKEKGRNNFQFFSPAMTAAATERMELERDLRIALRDGQLELHYQPQIDGFTGRRVGVEALARWRHPQHGLIAPMKFIPVAEETGLIEPLGRWVLDEACRQLAQWRAAGVDCRMAVNLSAQQLRAPDLVATVRETLHKHGLGHGDLELEITESTAMADPERAIGQLKALRELGVELSIDDFGTGYSSLAYLKLLPIQTLKLDRAFVRDIECDDNDAQISAATIALAHSLGLKVVAEGIETEGQAAFLRRHRCDYLQGFLFGKPVPADQAPGPQQG